MIYRHHVWHSFCIHSKYHQKWFHSLWPCRHSHIFFFFLVCVSTWWHCFWQCVPVQREEELASPSLRQWGDAANKEQAGGQRKTGCPAPRPSKKGGNYFRSQPQILLQIWFTFSRKYFIWQLLTSRSLADTSNFIPKMLNIPLMARSLPYCPRSFHSIPVIVLRKIRI